MLRERNTGEVTSTDNIAKPELVTMLTDTSEMILC